MELVSVTRDQRCRCGPAKIDFARRGRSGAARGRISGPQPQTPTGPV